MVSSVKAYLARAALTLGFALSGASLAHAADTDEEAAPSSDESAKSASEDKVDDKPAKEATEDAPKNAASYGHGRQFGLRVGLVGGYRMVLRYEKSPLCRDFEPSKGQDQVKFCGYGAPLALDFALSGALIDSFEPFLWARVGLAGEERTNTAPLLILGLGARIYTMSDSAFKIFVEPALGVELEGKGDSKDAIRSAIEEKYYKTDLVLHLAAGPHFDIHKNFGFYADAGLTLGVLRYLHSTLELSAGIQGRLP
jgi:hypothetical protein